MAMDGSGALIFDGMKLRGAIHDAEAKGGGVIHLAGEPNIV